MVRPRVAVGHRTWFALVGTSWLLQRRLDKGAQRVGNVQAGEDVVRTGNSNDTSPRGLAAKPTAAIWKPDPAQPVTRRRLPAGSLPSRSFRKEVIDVGRSSVIVRRARSGVTWPDACGVSTKLTEADYAMCLQRAGSGSLGEWRRQVFR